MHAYRSTLEGSPRRFRNPRDGDWYVQVTQGETYVTKSEDEVLTTVLGSCVSACIRDPLMRVGGMNHFLLPDADRSGRDSQRYGAHAMELLINKILKRGGLRQRLEAKIFGGANVISSGAEIGSRNAAFARQYLLDEGIRLVGGDVGGTQARRIQYWPVSGRVRQLAISTDVRPIVELEVRSARSIVEEADDVELF
ncbi:MAG: chemotaxis protein CheD [Alphaproteobacteria bacterium]|nr:chemotaxis protein CheD [Alphaproteobacteria bacterium]MDX5416726.1 chemotaxis protein CheD [Alphaproteobacteria bacterium]MDX5494110.1 chemotaxis protein CheD [Alphaproteobacteria bacterium]